MRSCSAPRPRRCAPSPPTGAISAPRSASWRSCLGADPHPPPAPPQRRARRRPVAPTRPGRGPALGVLPARLRSAAAWSPPVAATGRLCQTAVRRAAPRPRLSRPLHPPRRDRHQPAHRHHRHPGRLPPARLPPPAALQADDPRRHRVYPPLPAAHPAGRLSPHPLLRLLRQSPARRQACPVSPPARSADAARRSPAAAFTHARLHRSLCLSLPAGKKAGKNAAGGLCRLRQPVDISRIFDEIPWLSEQGINPALQGIEIHGAEKYQRTAVPCFCYG
jgi:hypothetical protein